MAATEEPILSRVDRLDDKLRQLEEITQIRVHSYRTPIGSCPSTRSSGTLTSDGHASSFDFSSKSLEKYCCPINHVIMETELKGTLIERLNHVEDRMLKLEAEFEAERKREEKAEKKNPKMKKKDGFKQLVNQCVPKEPNIKLRPTIISVCYSEVSLWFF